MQEHKRLTTITTTTQDPFKILPKQTQIQRHCIQGKNAKLPLPTDLCSGVMSESPTSRCALMPFGDVVISLELSYLFTHKCHKMSTRFRILWKDEEAC